MGKGCPEKTVPCVYIVLLPYVQHIIPDFFDKDEMLFGFASLVEVPDDYLQAKVLFRRVGNNLFMSPSFPRVPR